MNSKRWFPLGEKGEALQVVPSCTGDAACNRNLGRPCRCTIAVTPQMVRERVMAWL